MRVGEGLKLGSGRWAYISVHRVESVNRWWTVERASLDLGSLARGQKAEEEEDASQAPEGGRERGWKLLRV